MPTTDEAICIATVDYSETSQVVNMLTRENGAVRLLAKGSKRPKSKSGGAIDLFSEGRCVFAGTHRESLGTLMEFAETVSHAALRADLARLNTGLCMLELCGALLAEQDPAPEVFDLLSRALVRLAQADASPPAVLAYFQWRLLRYVGLLGELTECVSCGEPFGRGARARRSAFGGAGVYFSSAAGGLLCRNCEPAATEKLAVAPAALAGIAALAAAEAGKRPKLPDKQAHAVNAVLAYHVEYQIGKRLKTTRGVIQP